jgi:hypothetical protein
MMKHLERAKTRLESDKDMVSTLCITVQLQKQGEVQLKVTEQLQKATSEIQEEKLSEIEDRLAAEIVKRREVERQLIVLNEQVRNQKQLDHLKKLSNFIQTR